MAGMGTDIELTNRCNAKCHFCPRDQTPHQGLMSPETFEKSLERVIEYSDLCIEHFGTAGARNINLCGLGEPLLNKHAPAFVRQVREAGLHCRMNTNAALLDERRGAELLDAGLEMVFINAGDIDEEYERVYQLPFEKTKQNIARFAEMAGDQCEVWMVLVEHHDNPQHSEDMRKYWADLGVTKVRKMGVMNRGGALFVDHMQYESYPELAEAKALLAERPQMPLCIAPFVFLFIGYDGQYYLCCSDWKKEAPLGSVFDTSFMGTVNRKVELATSRELVCRTCNHDPINQMTDVLRAIAAGEMEPGEKDARLDHVDNLWTFVRNSLETLEPGVTDVSAIEGRRRIPIATL
jgi:MoaA/NifB/PqqE/SkfB family radical SAM enzyme